MISFNVPGEIKLTTEVLQNKGFEAYIVGGCVRDLVMGRKPKDWDLTTNAVPEEIMKAFPNHFYNNKYGTVTVVNDASKDKTLNNIEITPFRVESAYSNKRHPDRVTFTKSLNEDLARRDFTINAMAYDVLKGHLIDIHKGQSDLKDKKIRSVGNPKERFAEDALRMMRAVRIATELKFSIDTATKKAIFDNASSISEIAMERVRDEFSRIMLSLSPKKGLETLRDVGLLQHIIPELLEGVDIKQNQAHSFHVWEHNLRTAQHAADRDWTFHVRLAALFHDVAKPHTREWRDEKNDWTFYGHDVVGAKITRKILTRLKFSHETIGEVSKLVRYHLFFSDTEKITMSAVRRLVKNVGKDHIWELMNLRACDRIGTGRPKEQPYRLRKYESMVEEAMRDPISVGMLEIDGANIMKVTREKPGPRIGYILHALLEEVLDNPKQNSSQHLEGRAKELSELSDKKLQLYGERGKDSREKLEEDEISKIRQKHWVK